MNYATWLFTGISVDFKRATLFLRACFLKEHVDNYQK